LSGHDLFGPEIAGITINVGQISLRKRIEDPPSLLICLLGILGKDIAYG
jgi:hypothetical protein